MEITPDKWGREIARVLISVSHGSHNLPLCIWPQGYSHIQQTNQSQTDHDTRIPGCKYLLRVASQLS